MRFFNIHSVANYQKIERGTIWGKKSIKKSRTAEKNERGDALVSTGMVCYADKQEKPFWFNWLGQIVQFGPIIFCTTFKNYFGQFVWIENKTGTSKVGAISKAQEAQKNFFQKKF